jgi:hypothetical protein
MKSSSLALLLTLTNCSSTPHADIDASHPASPLAEPAPPREPLHALALDGSEAPATESSTPGQKSTRHPSDSASPHGAHSHGDPSHDH